MTRRASDSWLASTGLKGPPVFWIDALVCHLYPSDCLFNSEKEAIIAARKLRVTEIDRLTKEIGELDDRYNVLEDAEIAAGMVKA